MRKVLRAFGLGYEGVSLDQYVEVLKANAIAIVIDVRETPWSYKPGFSKKPLEARLHAEGISYVHLKSAGNPSRNRKMGLPPSEVITLYKHHLAANPSCLSEILAILKEAPKGGRACLLCFERNSVDCHRKVILDELSQQGHPIVVSHLLVEEEAQSLDKKPLTPRRVPNADDSERSRVHMEIAKNKPRAITV